MTLASVILNLGFNVSTYPWEFCGSEGKFWTIFLSTSEFKSVKSQYSDVLKKSIQADKNKQTEILSIRNKK